MGLRGTAFYKLDCAEVPDYIVELLRSKLQEDEMNVDCGVTELDSFHQTDEAVQGENHSPPLLSVIVSDIPHEIEKHHLPVKLFLYATYLI